jgi:ribosomal protein L44E
LIAPPAADKEGVASLTAQLECVECAQSVNRFERGWRAYLALMDPEAEEPVEVAVYCPTCAEFELGDDATAAAS